MPDFFFKTTKFEALLLSIPKSLRLLSTISFLALLCAVWFTLVHKPLLKYYQLNQKNYSTLSSMHNVSNHIEKKNKKVEKLIKRKNILLNKCKQNVTSENSRSIEEATNTIVSTLFDCAQKSQLTITRHTPVHSTQSDSFQSFHHTNEFQGSFQSITNFLQNLAKNNPGILLKSLNISKQDNDSLILTINFTINKFKEDCNEKK